jgi:hypothetical protein
VKAGALPLTVLPETVGICQLPHDSPLPEWTRGAAQLLSITRTPTELSIVADENVIPRALTAQRGYRVLRVEGPLPLNLVGVFAAVAGPLADAEVPIFPIGTYETDYVLVHDDHLATALATLRAAGHVVR